MTETMKLIINFEKKNPLTEWLRIQGCRSFHPKMMSAFFLGNCLRDGTL